MSESPDEWLRAQALRTGEPAAALRTELVGLRRFASYVANLGAPGMDRLRFDTAVEDLIRLAEEALGCGSGRPGLGQNDGGEAEESEVESRAGTAGEAPTKVPSGSV
jgi:hypothetical protein